MEILSILFFEKYYLKLIFKKIKHQGQVPSSYEEN